MTLEPPARYHRARWRLLTVWIVAFTITGAVLFWWLGDVSRRNQQLIRDGVQARTAICALRTDLEVRVAASRMFLENHPEGIAGISAAVITDAINNEQQTIDALAFLNCEKGAS